MKSLTGPIRQTWWLTAKAIVCSYLPVSSNRPARLTSPGFLLMIRNVTWSLVPGPIQDGRLYPPEYFLLHLKSPLFPFHCRQTFYVSPIPPVIATFTDNAKLFSSMQGLVLVQYWLHLNVCLFKYAKFYILNESWTGK